MVEVALVGCVLALVAWFVTRHFDTAHRRASCAHVNAGYISLDNRGVWWNRHCPECGWQEPYRVTIPPRHHPDDPRCIHKDACECALVCQHDASRKR